MSKIPALTNQRPGILLAPISTWLAGATPRIAGDICVAVPTHSCAKALMRAGSDHVPLPSLVWCPLCWELGEQRAFGDWLTASRSRSYQEHITRLCLLMQSVGCSHSPTQYRLERPYRWPGIESAHEGKRTQVRVFFPDHELHRYPTAINARDTDAGQGIGAENGQGLTPSPLVTDGATVTDSTGIETRLTDVE